MSYHFQATHTDSVLKISSHRSLRAHVRFHTSSFLRPRPPSSFGDVTDSQETLALLPASSDPFQRRGSQFRMDNFLVHSGRPRYRMGREPLGIPELACNVSISVAERPDGKKQDFSGLMQRPDICLNSSRTERIP